MRTNEVLHKKSKLQPLGLKIKSNCYVIGDKYIKSILVTGLPRQFNLAMLSNYVSKPNLKVFMRTDHLDLDCASMLKKEYKDKEEHYHKSGSDPSQREQLESELRSLNTYIAEVVNNHDSTWNVTIIFSVFSDTEKEVLTLCKDLKLRLRAEGFKVTSADMMQENLMRLASPVFMNSLLPKEIERNIGIPLPSLGLAGLYPFIFETLKDPYGFLLGYERVNQGVIILDQFYYLNNVDESVLQNRVNGNMVLVGGSGFGKTTTLMMLIRSYLRQRIKLIWIDPENKNRALTKRYGGTFINWGRSGYLINIFDLKPISVEEDEDPSIMWDTEVAMYNVIDDIKIVMQYLFPTISDETLSCIGDIAIKTYAYVGIDFQTPFKGMEKEKYPTFTEFDHILDQEIKACIDMHNQRELNILYDLKIKLKPLLREWSIYFNGHTTIDTANSNIIAFGTKILFGKADNLKNALNHIMYQYAWALCLNENQQSAFVLDEAHIQILSAKSAELVAQFVRRSRKYKNVCAIATQEPKDFAVEEFLIHGKAIFNNSAYKIIMHLEQDGAMDLRKLMNMNDNEQAVIENCMRGDALLVCGKRRIPIHVLPTENELYEMGIN